MSPIPTTRTRRHLGVLTIFAVVVAVVLATGMTRRAGAQPATNDSVGTADARGVTDDAALTVSALECGSEPRVVHLSVSASAPAGITSITVIGTTPEGDTAFSLTEDYPDATQVTDLLKTTMTTDVTGRETATMTVTLKNGETMSVTSTIDVVKCVEPVGTPVPVLPVISLGEPTTSNAICPEPATLTVPYSVSADRGIAKITAFLGGPGIEYRQDWDREITLRDHPSTHSGDFVFDVPADLRSTSAVVTIRAYDTVFGVSSVERVVDFEISDDCWWAPTAGVEITEVTVSNPICPAPATVVVTVESSDPQSATVISGHIYPRGKSGEPVMVLHDDVVGSGDLSFEIPADAPTGRWVVSVGPDRLAAGETEYRSDVEEFNVEAGDDDCGDGGDTANAASSPTTTQGDDSTAPSGTGHADPSGATNPQGSSTSTPTPTPSGGTQAAGGTSLASAWPSNGSATDHDDDDDRGESASHRQDREPAGSAGSNNRTASSAASALVSERQTPTPSGATAAVSTAGTTAKKLAYTGADTATIWWLGFIVFAVGAGVAVRQCRRCDT